MSSKSILTAAIAAGMACALTGCRQNVYREVYAEQNAREIRALEDRIYEYDAEYRSLEQELWTKEAQNEQLLKKLAQLSSGEDARSRSSNKSKSAPPPPETMQAIEDSWSLPPVLDPNYKAKGSDNKEKEAGGTNPEKPNPEKPVEPSNKGAGSNDQPMKIIDSNSQINELPRPVTPGSGTPRDVPGESIAPPPKIRSTPQNNTPQINNQENNPPQSNPPQNNAQPQNNAPPFGNPGNSNPPRGGFSAPIPGLQQQQSSPDPTPPGLTPGFTPPFSPNPTNNQFQPPANPFPQQGPPSDRDRSDASSSRISLPEIDSAVRQASHLQPTSSPKETKSREIDRTITGIFFHPALCRGINFDETPEDDGVYIVLQPQNAIGEFIADAGEVTIIAVDPSRPEGENRIARWTYSPDELAKVVHNTGSSRGYHLPLRWQSDKPKGNEVQIFARYVMPDGKKMVAERKVVLHLRDSMQSVWTPRASSTSVPPKNR